MYVLSNFTSFWDFVILGIIGDQGQDAIFGAVYAHKGCTKKISVMVCTGLHWISLP